MKKIFFTFLAVLVSFVSCIDSEEINIAYKSEIKVTAAHLFDDYTPFLDGDFDYTKDGWDLNLQVLIYDQQGKLISKSEKLCNSMSDNLCNDVNLEPGNYTMVSIADFRNGLGGEGYKFWEITKEESLQDLSITENQNIYPVVFETLGIDMQKITVSNSSQNISVDIKPVTSLVEIFMSDKDYTGWGLNGYSRFSALSAGYFVKALKFKNNIRFNESSLDFNYSEQVSDYNLARSNVYDKWMNRESPTGYSYRALLPEKDKGFCFNIVRRELPDDLYQSYLIMFGDFDKEGVSNVLPSIDSNKQYVVNMIFDCLQLVAFEHTDKFDHDTFTVDYVSTYKKGMMSKMVNFGYEKMLGKSESAINTFVNSEPYDNGVTPSLFVSYYPRSRSDHFESFMTGGYNDESKSKCVLFDLLLPKMNNDDIQYLVGLLSDKYRVEEEMTGGNIYCFIDPTATEDSHYRIVLNTNNNENITLSYILRKQYQ